MTISLAIPTSKSHSRQAKKERSGPACLKRHGLNCMDLIPGWKAVSPTSLSVSSVVFQGKDSVMKIKLKTWKSFGKC